MVTKTLLHSSCTVVFATAALLVSPSRANAHLHAGPGCALQLPARLGMKATAYVVSGRISGDDPSFLTWPLLHALEQRGIEIGSHTVAHRDMTALSDRALLADLTESRRTLEHPGRAVASATRRRTQVASCFGR